MKRSGKVKSKRGATRGLFADLSEGMKALAEESWESERSELIRKRYVKSCDERS